MVPLPHWNQGLCGTSHGAGATPSATLPKVPWPCVGHVIAGTNACRAARSLTRERVGCVRASCLLPPLANRSHLQQRGLDRQQSRQRVASLQAERPRLVRVAGQFTREAAAAPQITQARPKGAPRRLLLWWAAVGCCCCGGSTWVGRGQDREGGGAFNTRHFQGEERRGEEIGGPRAGGQWWSLMAWEGRPAWRRQCHTRGVDTRSGLALLQRTIEAGTAAALALEPALAKGPRHCVVRACVAVAVAHPHILLNQHARTHARTHAQEFWAWSWDEMAKFDVPAVVEEVRTVA